MVSFISINFYFIDIIMIIYCTFIIKNVMINLLEEKVFMCKSLYPNNIPSFTDTSRTFMILNYIWSLKRFHLKMVNFLGPDYWGTRCQGCGQLGQWANLTVIVKSLFTYCDRASRRQKVALGPKCFIFSHGTAPGKVRWISAGGSGGGGLSLLLRIPEPKAPAFYRLRSEGGVGYMYKE